MRGYAQARMRHGLHPRLTPTLTHTSNLTEGRAESCNTEASHSGYAAGRRKPLEVVPLHAGGPTGDEVKQPGLGERVGLLDLIEHHRVG